MSMSCNKCSITEGCFTNAMNVPIEWTGYMVVTLESGRVIQVCKPCWRKVKTLEKGDAL